MIIQNQYLRRWISETYPLMSFNEESSLSELDFYDFEKFAVWLKDKIEREIKLTSPQTKQTIEGLADSLELMIAVVRTNQLHFNSELSKKIQKAKVWIDLSKTITQ